MLNVSKIRQQFPILHQEVNGYPLVYLDNGATTHKPKVVIDAKHIYYQELNSNWLSLAQRPIKTMVKQLILL